jgi:hypothetical protein
METRVADLHRNAERESIGMAEPLLAAHSDTNAATASRLRCSLGRALVRAGSRVGGFDIPPTRTIRESLTSCG